MCVLFKNLQGPMELEVMDLELGRQVRAGKGDVEITWVQEIAKAWAGVSLLPCGELVETWVPLLGPEWL